MKLAQISPVLSVSMMSVLAALSGCSDPGGAQEGAVGSAQVAITSAPSDVSCVRITAVGSRTITRPFDVTPGQSTVLSLASLPVGGMTFSADAFSSACSAIVAGSAAPWVSDPVQATVTAGAPTTITLAMRRNGQVNVNVDFPPDEGTPTDGGAPRTDASTSGPIAFVSRDVSLPVPATSIVAGDLDQNGTIDLVTGSNTTPQVFVLANPFGGTFGPALATTIPAPATALGLLDFNADHKTDLVATLVNGSAASLQNNGATFSTAATFGLPSPATALAVVDQGFVVGSSNASQTTSVLVSSLGTLSISGSLGVPGDGQAAFASGDLNGDGRLDFVAAYPNQGTVGIFFAGPGGPGSFTMQVRVPTVPTPTMVAIGDMNGDGRPEIVVGGAAAQLTILTRNTDGAPFAALPAVPISAPPSALAAGDFNHDGRADVIVANPGNMQVVQLGAGSAAQVTAVGPGVPSPAAIAVGDFNGDARSDFALVGPNRPSVTIFTSN